ncbi:MAG: type II toxin-antitoxin system Phd/YefM family antitoxin [Deltaproteobacteria bacterium]|nr:type II toxin-antitoxin system Phd/YefM family antitoxin [Deltaproteobacteria bacterium]
MTRTISTMEARRQLGDILNRVALRHDQYIIERKGVALAAVVPVERLEQMQRAATMHLLELLDRQEPSLSQREADDLANEAKHRSRPRRRRG